MTWLHGLAAVALVIGTPATGSRDIHKDSNLGFQISVPGKWKKIPIASRENWIVAKYISKRTLWTKKGMGAHNPEMKVILFPHATVNEKGVEVTKKGKSITVRIKNPYKDFDAWMKANASGGYYATSEKERVVNKIKATCMEYRFEKLTTPRRALAWIFHGKDADWAVYFEGLDDYWRSLSPTFLSSLKTFKFIKRKGSIIRAGTTSDSAITIKTDDKELTPAERDKQRKQKFDKELRVASKRMEKGWKIQKSKNYVAITHVDSKYTTRMLKQAEAVRKWLEKKFGYVGQQKAGRAIIRICDSMDEESAFRDTSSGSWGLGLEIVTHKDLGGGRRSFETQFLNGRVTSIWFADKNPELRWGMPSWLQQGIDQVLRTSYVKGGRLVFKPDQWEQNQLRELKRQKKLVRPRDFLTASWQEFNKKPGATHQAALFVRFLLSGPKKQTKRFLEDYMYELIQLIEERSKKDKEAAKKKGAKEQTEEEQAAQYKARRQAEKKRLQAVFDKAFGSWSESKWKKFEQAYRSFAG